jgi:hypothetical protein
MIILLNQKVINIKEEEKELIENEEEKKLFLLTKYNTIINKKTPIDIEMANKSKQIFIIFYIIYCMIFNLLQHFSSSRNFRINYFIS